MASVARTGADAGADRTPTGRDGAKTDSRRHCPDTEPTAAFASAADERAPGSGSSTGGAAGSAPAARPRADSAAVFNPATPRASRAAGFYPAASPRAGSAAGPDSAARDAGPDRFSIAAPRDGGSAATSIPGAAITPGRQAIRKAEDSGLSVNSAVTLSGSATRHPGDNCANRSATDNDTGE